MLRYHNRHNVTNLLFHEYGNKNADKMLRHNMNVAFPALRSTRLRATGRVEASFNTFFPMQGTRLALCIECNIRRIKIYDFLKATHDDVWSCTASVSYEKVQDGERLDESFEYSTLNSRDKTHSVCPAKSQVAISSVTFLPFTFHVPTKMSMGEKSVYSLSL